jgi:hypothetical protein
MLVILSKIIYIPPKLITFLQNKLLFPKHVTLLQN